MHIGGKRAYMVKARKIGGAILDLLQVMADCPPLRHGIAEELGKLPALVLGNRIAPGPEGSQQAAIRIEGHIAMHHGADAEGLEPREGDAVSFLDILPQRGIAVRKPFHYILDGICPDTVLIAVLPVMEAACYRGLVRPDEDCLDPCRSEFDSEAA